VFRFLELGLGPFVQHFLFPFADDGMIGNNMLVLADR